MSLLNISSSLPGTVKVRARIEAQIARRVVESAIAKGYSVSVDDGEEITLSRSRDVDAILNAMWTTDEDRLYINLPNAKRLGMIYFVYGNEGFDVINDYSVSLEEPFMSEVNAWVEREWE
jgi:multidrug efflux pump subunit AcrA (membrane-fusion protein)